MRAILLLIISLFSCMAEAHSYAPKGYVADIAAYYPEVSSASEVEEIVALESVYSMLPRQVQNAARKRVAMVLSRGLPLEVKLGLFAREIEQNKTRLEMLPPDAKKAIKPLQDSYWDLPPSARNGLINMSVTGDKSVLEDYIIAGYMAKHAL